MSNLVEATSAVSFKLDFGCGQSVRDGFEGVDLYSSHAKHKVDLFKFPFPWIDNTVDEIHCSHFAEHIPAREIEDRDLSIQTINNYQKKFVGQDMFLAFMDECYRILKPDGWMTVVVPSGRSSRAFWDPTHRRFFMQETFLYLNKDWRVLQKLDHYNVKCNFGVEVGHSLPQEEQLRNVEAQAVRFQHYWNTTIDWIAKLKKLP